MGASIGQPHHLERRMGFEGSLDISMEAVLRLNLAKTDCWEVSKQQDPV